MESLLSTAVINLAVALGFMTLIWLASLPLRDTSIVDRFWGLGFLLLAISTLVMSEGATLRAWLVLGAVALWGLRLSGYITWRNWGKGEDPRYAKMREKRGAKWPMVSLFLVFWLQGALLWFIASSLQAAISADAPAGLTVFDILGLVVWACGFLCEAVADWQMQRFKADPANKGQVMDRGLWRYSRHPNYFGDALAWWGIYILACSTPYGPYTILSPILMTWLLRSFSGVPMTEGDIEERRPGYKDYIRRTNAFVPWFPER